MSNKTPKIMGGAESMKPSSSVWEIPVLLLLIVVLAVGGYFLLGTL
jgi:hypothetical protein